MKVRSLPYRFWLSYMGYRRLFGRWGSLRAAVALEMLWQKSKRGVSDAHKYKAGGPD